MDGENITNEGAMFIGAYFLKNSDGSSSLVQTEDFELDIMPVAPLDQSMMYTDDLIPRYFRDSYSDYRIPAEDLIFGYKKRFYNQYNIDSGTIESMVSKIDREKHLLSMSLNASLSLTSISNNKTSTQADSFIFTNVPFAFVTHPLPGKTTKRYVLVPNKELIKHGVNEWLIQIKTKTDQQAEEVIELSNLSTQAEIDEKIDSVIKKTDFFSLYFYYQKVSTQEN